MAPRKSHLPLLVFGGAWLILAACNSGRPVPEQLVSAHTAPQLPPPGDSSGVAPRVEMRNVHVRLDPDITVRIRQLSGTLQRTNKDKPPTFDDKLSYIIDIESAEIGMTTAGMTVMLNRYVFGDKDSPLKDLKLTIENGQVKQTGTIRKGIGIPFETVGDMSPTPEGLVRIHPAKMKAGHLPVKGLMKLFGVDMAELINTRHTRGIRVDENDIVLDPSRALPPPKMRGRVTAVRIESDEIVQVFGSPKPIPAKPPKAGSNYMAYRGGTLQFGRLTMRDTDMRLVDADPRDPFDFSPDHYGDHLVAGYSKSTASGGLIVYMPDFARIATPLSPR